MRHGTRHIEPLKLLGAVEGRVEFNENEREHLKDCEECSRVFAAFENHFAEGTGGSAKSGTSGRGSEIEYGRLRRFKVTGSVSLARLPRTISACSASSARSLSPATCTAMLSTSKIAEPTRSSDSNSDWRRNLPWPHNPKGKNLERAVVVLLPV